ncbi:Wall-associated receptor kinase 2, partial [Mucuna pruriens]
MGLKATQMQMRLTLMLMVALVAADQALPGCPNTCGSVSVPYPFGIGSANGNNCFFEEALKLTCKRSTLYHGDGNVQILNITIDGKLDMLLNISQACKIEPYRGQVSGNIISLSTPAFTISSDDNKFVSVGCDTYGYLNTFRNGITFSTGCLTRCDSKESIESMQSDGNCSGIGCCEVDIPPGMKNISIQAFSFNNFNYSSNFSNCSYSFVVKNGNYTFWLDQLNNFPFQNSSFVVDWTVGNDTCQNSMHRPDYYACKSNSECENSATGYGYRCKCKAGYEGNPYHPDGCRDILECTTHRHNCASDDYCHEIEGSFQCLCPEGLTGNATKEGGGCLSEQRDDVFTKVVIGAGVGLIALFMGTSWLYLIYQKRKVIKLKEKFFKQNGGIILKQHLSREDSSQSTTIFTAEELKKATNDFDENLIIGKGGYGTVFKGFLSNNNIVAIKKSKIVDQSQVEQFINEVVVLSQINHRNVVKLLGCCLETEVPLLVYEFVNNGTLYDYLHNECKAANVCWKARLRIATEAAGALSYLHSAASIPIIHRDVKTANILLDDNYTAKVSDFGASRLVPLDQTEIATIVQGTFGYLDPEYMQTSQLTEKSDVYSFGVVLVELLTGEKPFSFDRPEEKRSLTIHFLSCFKEDRLFEVLQIGILDEENKQEIMEVAILAAKCLRLTGEERPSMKEVAMELERIRLVEKHPWTNTGQISEEAQFLLHEACSTHEHGDSTGHQNTGYDSLRDLELIDLGDGR